MLCAGALTVATGEGLEDDGITSGGIGAPPLWTARITASPSSSAVKVTGVPSPCWIALPTRFDTTCASRSASQFPTRSPLAFNPQHRLRVCGAAFENRLLAQLLKVGLPPLERDRSAKPDARQVQ